MKEYKFYGAQNADIKDSRGLTPRDYYDLLSDIWCEYTCAPRMRSEWSKENITKGQCSITAFLMQDIFGGKVFGVPLGDDNYHCFNAVGSCVFDLTSEQFNKKLNYSDCPEQSREKHFSKEEKKARYEYLKAELEKKFLKTFYAKNREEWRAWLKENFETECEIWFVFPTKDSGEKGVTYNDAVEEALCFGWIDSTAKTLDKTHHIRHFTPRKKGSPYSRPNIERLIFLDSKGMLCPKVKEEVKDLINAPFVFPKDIIKEIKKDREAWENYKTFTEPYKRIRVAYIDAARKRPDEFEKRLKNFIEKTKKIS